MCCFFVVLMMQRTKIKFSAEEAALMNNTVIILTKNRVIQKVYDLFGSISNACGGFIDSVALPEDVIALSSKISKGENYLGLPYVILDQPRYFSKGDVLAVRTMFWWGHYFSVTLHLKGMYKNIYSETISDKYDQLAEAGAFVAITENEWHHSLDEEHYVQLSLIKKESFRKMISNHPFLKISFKVPMELNEKLEEELLKKLSEVILLLDC